MPQAAASYDEKNFVFHNERTGAHDTQRRPIILRKAMILNRP